MDTKGVVQKLVGKIVPVGETIEDNDRFENLKVMTDLVNALVIEIDHIAFHYKDSPRYSEKRAGEFAENFLTKTLNIKE